MVDPEVLARDFEAAFRRPPRLFRAPGRVNLIGEHTDYNDGFVMPIALDRYTWTAAAPRPDRTIVVRSREMGDTHTIDLDRLTPGRTGHWSDYVRGIAAVLDRGHNGNLRGADMLIASDVPIGAGLSSSAALEVACGYTLLALAGLPIDLTALALAAQRAEHEFAGTRCGIMDQMIACHGRAGHALLLDTRSLAADWLPLPPQIRVVIANTMVAHTLASAEYNERRVDCEAGVAILAARFPGVRALRDTTLEQLEAMRDAIPPRIYGRCRHVIAENARVIAAAAALIGGDFQRFGELMADSHRSLRDDYEVSCAELDAMVLVISAVRGVYGARMTGGGFGGSVVAIADDRIDEASMRVRIQDGYRARTGLQPDPWFASAGTGVGAWPSFVMADG